MKRQRICFLVGFFGLCVLGGGHLYSADREPGVGERLAEELKELTGNAFRVHQSGVVELVTDAEDVVAGKCVVHLNQSLPKMRALARFPADAPAPKAAIVVLFAKRDGFSRFLRARKSPLEESYTLVRDAAGPVITAYVLDDRPMLARLRHLGMELLTRTWFPNPPPWLVEGLGEVVEDLRWDEKGEVQLEPGRSHQRDLLEKVMMVKPSKVMPMPRLVGLDRAAWDGAGLPAYAQSWSFVRFLLEDPGAREARLLQKVLARLNPRGDEVDNLKRAQSAFQDDEWYALEAAWLDYAKKLPETSGEDAYRQAREKLEKGDAASARPLLDDAIKADPLYERLYYFRGVSAYEGHDYESAVKDLNRALALFPEYHAARFLRGQCRLGMKDAAGARADFEACLETDYRDQAKKSLEKL